MEQLVKLKLLGTLHASSDCQGPTCGRKSHVVNVNKV
jgi:hypothetical protein